MKCKGKCKNNIKPDSKLMSLNLNQSNRERSNNIIVSSLVKPHENIKKKTSIWKCIRPLDNNPDLKRLIEKQTEKRKRWNGVH